MLIFICFVVVIVILKERSDLHWLASVPLPACLDYALPQSTADNADPSRLFAASRFVFLSDSLVCQVWHGSLNFRIFRLIFICFVVVIVILKARSPSNWLARVPLPVCLDDALP